MADDAKLAWQHGIEVERKREIKNDVYEKENEYVFHLSIEVVEGVGARKQEVDGAVVCNRRNEEGHPWQGVEGVERIPGE